MPTSYENNDVFLFILNQSIVFNLTVFNCNNDFFGPETMASDYERSISKQDQSIKLTGREYTFSLIGLTLSVVSMMNPF